MTQYLTQFTSVEDMFCEIDQSLLTVKFIFSLNKKINFILFPSFNDLINISKKSKILITCHGSMTHVANCFNVKIIDIIEKKKEKFDARCTSYIRNYSPIYREKFEVLKKNILDIS